MLCCVPGGKRLYNKSLAYLNFGVETVEMQKTGGISFKLRSETFELHYHVETCQIMN
jgi:hypothetical protein